MKKAVKLAAIGCLLAAGFLVTARSAAQSGAVDFDRDINPILKARCAQCHNAQRAMGGLRLDTREHALRVLNPTRSSESRLVHRILGEGGEPRMPMVGDPLTPDQISLIKRWIDEGAVWAESQSAATQSGSKHWAFVAPSRPAPPQVRNSAWVRTPIDSFVLAELEKRSFSPSKQADRVTLIRRLSLDITGLPPSIEDVDRFVSDKSPEAYEKLVDQLLASPHYGEKWARWWLDSARYADSNGFEKDRARSIWPYRDWVISAMNRDLSFDRFTTEQLAGDLLPNASLDQRIATGFLRNSMINEEGGVDPEQFRIEGIIDRVDAVGKAFLGLTISCAQCHSHKFDPIPHEDYYKFFALLNNDDEPEIEVPDAKLKATRADLASRIAKVQDNLLASDPSLRTSFANWEEREKTLEQPAWTPLQVTELAGSNGVKGDLLPDNSVRVRRYVYGDANYIVKLKTSLKGITGLRLELLTDPNLPRTGPGISSDGMCVLSEISVTASSPSKPEVKEKVAISGATADFSQSGFPVEQTLDGNPKTGWGIDSGPARRNQPRQAVFALKSPVGYDDGSELTVQLLQKIGKSLVIGRFRLSATTGVDPKVDPIPVSIRRILETPREKRTETQRRELLTHYLGTDPKYAEASRSIDEAFKQWPYGPTTLALAACSTPRVTRLFKRGDWKRPGDVIEPGTPSFLHELPEGAPHNRLGLAEWIVDARNPLTARVIVNRVWQQYFGAGLVATPEDFGTRCEKPSHPDLLDWLAVEFRESGWSFRKLHRLIVTSAVYMQESGVNAKILEADPLNRYLERAPRIRSDAEVIRDIALSASGLLSSKIGGPSVFPPIPDGVLTLGYGDPMKWVTSEGEDRYRRGMYTFWKRSVPYPSLAVFDMPNADVACTRRARSNTPLQALTLLNDAVFVEAAQALALRAWKSGSDDRSRMIHAFRLCLSREPDEFELRQLLSALQVQYNNFASNTASAVYVSSSDVEKLVEGVDLHKIAAWTMISRTLLNLDETMTKR